MHTTRSQHPRGFTLIELLVVIGIIAILAAIVAIAVNPNRQYGQARNAQRWSDINALLNAVHQYAADHEGSFPAGITASATNISNAAYNLCTFIVPTYMAAMPADPNVAGATGGTDCTSYDTKYSISLSGGRVTISAPGAEQSATISLTQ